MSTVARYLIVGCGYVGTRLGRALVTAAPVVGLTSSAASAAALDRQGIDGFGWDLDDPEAPPPAVLGQAASVFYLAPPQPKGTRDLRLTRFLSSLSMLPRRFVYMSTTGVYGDTQGKEVAEDAPLQPSGERAERRVDAERQVQDWAAAHAVPWTILRVPAIYGPGRLPTERLKRGEPLIRHSEAPLSSRIHVDDLVAACRLAISAPQAKHRIYNVADGNSTTMTEYLERVATLAGLPTPALVTRAEAKALLSPEVWSFLSDSRRIDASRIREELGFRPRFADLRLGILSSLPAP